jgi:selenocysteine-specific elongation factor
MRVVATAGHVDHGKSSLVLALTDTDPDRFPEEKARGLTIDIGFAFTELDDEIVGFVDVPGHIRFVKNMLAGVGAVEVAVVIIAATEGWMPQSEEHVRILELLDVRHGLIVITKADLVDDETLELAQLELADRLGDSLIASWPVVVCDSLSGRGIDAVRTSLTAVLAAAPRARDAGRARLWVDRVFSAKGAGTVVTGTLALGQLSVDDEVLIEPGARRARVRGIESHHQRLDRAEPGSRVAINLAGIEHTAVHRGDAIVRPGLWATPSVVDVEVLHVPGQQLPRRGQLSAHIGSGEHRVRWRALDDDGRVGRIRLDAAVPLAPGDRIVLRSTGRRATVGGAIVVDVDPPRRSVVAIERAGFDADGRLLAQRAWLRVDDVVQLAGVNRSDAAERLDAMVTSGRALRVGDAVAASEHLESLRRSARERVTTHHEREPHARGIDLASLASSLRCDSARLRTALEGDPNLVVEREIVRFVDHLGRASDDPEGQRFIEALEATPYAPPSATEAGVDPRIARALVREAVVVELDGMMFAASAFARARQLLAATVVERGTLTVSDARDLLGSSRKFVLPIVNQLDREGVTRRRGDDRIPGPTATAAAATPTPP